MTLLASVIAFLWGLAVGLTVGALWAAGRPRRHTFLVGRIVREANPQPAINPAQTDSDSLRAARLDEARRRLFRGAGDEREGRLSA
ncbi:MAG: hypothetical protein ACYC1Z_14680 [Georgenia sp.]